MNDTMAEVFEVTPVEVIDTAGVSLTIAPEGAEDEDHAYARDRHYELAEKGAEALLIAMKIVKETENPQAIKELSGLIKTLSEINKNLLHLHKDKADIQAVKGTGKNQPSTNVEQQNIIFAGSSKDLNKLIQTQLNELNK
jgi:hypothetical protein